MSRPTAQLPANQVSEQNILNTSFDPDFGVLVVQGLGYDGVNLVRQTADDQQIKVVDDGTYLYFCYSAVGTAEATASWKIFRLSDEGDKMYADGDANYDNAASDPTALSYSYT